jgi:SNF2 family DNA or RNA helicase
LHGGVARKQRDEMVERFQNDRTERFFLLSLKAGGTGLNLTAASNVIHYDLWWNPAVEAQATDRAYRIGQQRKVQVHRLITRATFEERINDMIRSKRDLADMAVGTGENWIGNLSNAELKEVFSLG